MAAQTTKERIVPMIKLDIDLSGLAKHEIVDVNDNHVIVNSELVIDIKDGEYYVSDCQTDLFFEGYAYLDAIKIILTVDAIDYAVDVINEGQIELRAGKLRISAEINTHCEDLFIDIENEPENSGYYDAPRELVHRALDESRPAAQRLTEVMNHCLAVI